MKLTSALFDAFLDCPTKCYLRSAGQTGTGNEYAGWVDEQERTFQGQARKRLLTRLPDSEVSIAPPAVGQADDAKWQLAVDVPVQTNHAELRLHAVERVPAQGRGKPANYTPVRFVFLNKITKHHRMLAVFDAIALSEVVGQEVGDSKIIHGDDHRVVSVKTGSLAGIVRKLMAKMEALLSSGSPPDHVLTRCCAECEFRDFCRQRAVEKDELTLLGGMTQKQRDGYRAKGLFTITQLSYTFRPRRTPKRTKTPANPHHYPLQALAIREKTVYIHGTPVLPRDKVEVYFDIEGLPDRDFYYLIGALVISNGQESFHSYWANSKSEEQAICSAFAGLALQYPTARLFHFGDYDAVALKRVASQCPEACRSQLAAIEGRCFNVLSVVHPHVYFPTHSNSLKEIGQFLEPSESEGTGLQTIIWRTDWEATCDGQLKNKLVTYNRRDCVLLKRLVDFISRHTAAEAPPEADPVPVNNTEKLKKHRPRWQMFARRKYALEDLRHIVKCGYFDYQRDKVLVKTDRVLAKASTRRTKLSTRHPRASKCVDLFLKKCPFCGSKALGPIQSRSRYVLDLKFTKSGVRRAVTRSRCWDYRCNECGKERSARPCFSTKQEFGDELSTWCLYFNVVLGLNMLKIGKSLRDIFGVNINACEAYRFKGYVASRYTSLDAEILASIVAGPVLHIDETVVNLRKEKGYVWVVTSMDMVHFFYRPTREAAFLTEILAGFSGVLVSDFFTGYDSLPCPQQKCLVHLVREIDEDLVHNPFDEQFKLLAQDFGSLVRPIIETTDRYGLKKRHLGKHKKEVDRFLREVDGIEAASELTDKYRKRFLKYWPKMFTFLDYDGVPWNNNNAEHAIKRFARYRRNADGRYTERSLGDYLVLASVLETCEYSGLNALNFLLSKENSLNGLLRMAGRKPEPPASTPNAASA